MKSKRAKEYVKTIKLNKANVDYCLEHGRVNGFLLIDIENAVELAERDAEERYHDDLCHYQLMMNDTCSHMIDERDEEVTRYRKELEESKKREELARKAIDDQRKEMAKVKARAVEAHRDCCRNFTKQCKCWDMDRGFDTPHTCNLQCSYMEKFIQKLNER